MRTVRDDVLRPSLKRRTQLVSRTNFLRSLNCLIRLYGHEEDHGNIALFTNPTRMLPHSHAPSLLRPPL